MVLEDLDRREILCEQEAYKYQKQKEKIEEKLKDLNAKYKEICDEEIQVENEEIIVTLRRNNISLEELMEKINDRKREEKLKEKENIHNEEI